MPGEPIVARFRLSQPEYLAAIRSIALRSWIYRVFFGLAGVGAAVSIALLLGGDVADAAPGILLTLLWVAYFSWCLYLGPIRRYRRQKTAHEEQVYRFDEDGVGIDFATGHSQVRWEHFSAIVETRTFYVLRQQASSVFSVIPRRAFATQADEGRFLELVARKLGQKEVGQGAGGRGKTPSSSKP